MNGLFCSCRRWPREVEVPVLRASGPSSEPVTLGWMIACPWLLCAFLSPVAVLTSSFIGKNGEQWGLAADFGRSIEVLVFSGYFVALIFPAPMSWEHMG